MSFDDGKLEQQFNSFQESYIILLKVLLFVRLCILQVFVDGCNLPLFIIDGLVQGLELLLDPLVSLLLGGELTAAALLGIEVRPLLCGLGKSGQEVRQSLMKTSTLYIMRQNVMTFTGATFKPIKEMNRELLTYLTQSLKTKGSSVFETVCSACADPLNEQML